MPKLLTNRIKFKGLRKMNTKGNTPEHCWECEQFKDCKQAQNMTADTKAVNGLVVFIDNDSEHYCDNCTPDKETASYPIGESDTPEHCCDCGVPLDHQLTDYGVEYVKEELAFNSGGCCRELWPVVWAEYLS
jgi:hypothetical protein